MKLVEQILDVYERKKDSLSLFNHEILIKVLKLFAFKLNSLKVDEEALKIATKMLQIATMEEAHVFEFGQTLIVLFKCIKKTFLK